MFHNYYFGQQYDYTYNLFNQGSIEHFQIKREASYEEDKRDQEYNQYNEDNGYKGYNGENIKYKNNKLRYKKNPIYPSPSPTPSRDSGARYNSNTSPSHRHPSPLSPSHRHPSPLSPSHRHPSPPSHSHRHPSPPSHSHRHPSPPSPSYPSPSPSDHSSSTYNANTSPSPTPSPDSPATYQSEYQNQDNEKSSNKNSENSENSEYNQNNENNDNDNNNKNISKKIIIGQVAKSKLLDPTDSSTNEMPYYLPYSQEECNHLHKKHMHQGKPIFYWTENNSLCQFPAPQVKTDNEIMDKKYHIPIDRYYNNFDSSNKEVVISNNNDGFTVNKKIMSKNAPPCCFMEIPYHHKES